MGVGVLGVDACGQHGLKRTGVEIEDAVEQLLFGFVVDLRRLR